MIQFRYNNMTPRLSSPAENKLFILFLSCPQYDFLRLTGVKAMLELNVPISQAKL